MQLSLPKVRGLEYSKQDGAMCPCTDTGTDGMCTTVMAAHLWRVTTLSTLQVLVL